MRAGVALVTVLLALSCGCSGPGAPRPAPAAPGPVEPSAPVPAPAASLFRSVRQLPAVQAPVRVRLARIGVDAAVEPVGRLPDGTVDVPRQWQQVGWYADGPRPGEAGPAVLLGHVDSTRGPAVFFRLRELRAGDLVEVITADGLVLPFVVRALARYAKADFPTDEVYLPTLRPEVRLVTCGGTFDRSTGHYRDNVVVFADAAG